MDERHLTGDSLRKKESEIGASLHEGGGVTAQMKSLAEGVSETAHRAYDGSSKMAGAASDFLSRFPGDVETLVRRRPIGAIMAALAMGVCIGWMSR